METERVIRSDCGDAHRLSLSARVLSTAVAQVKAKAAAAEALLTSVKTTVEHCIWVLSMRSAIGLIRIARRCNSVEPNQGSIVRPNACDAPAPLREIARRGRRPHNTRVILWELRDSQLTALSWGFVGALQAPLRSRLRSSRSRR